MPSYNNKSKNSYVKSLAERISGKPGLASATAWFLFLRMSSPETTCWRATLTNTKAATPQKGLWYGAMWASCGSSTGIGSARVRAPSGKNKSGDRKPARFLMPYWKAGRSHWNCIILQIQSPQLVEKRSVAFPHILFVEFLPSSQMLLVLLRWFFGILCLNILLSFRISCPLFYLTFYFRKRSNVSRIPR